MAIKRTCDVHGPLYGISLPGPLHAQKKEPYAEPMRTLPRRGNAALAVSPAHNE